MRMRLSSVTAVLGRALIAFGVLVFLFVAYQLWGTGLSESHSQDALRQQFESQLHSRGNAGHKVQPPPSGGSIPTTTVPSTTAQGTPPAEGQPVGIIRIAKIGLDSVVVEGTGTTDLQKGPGHFPNTPLPGQAGNVAIAGHRTTYGAPFFDLDELSTGDPIVITTAQGTFTYKVVRSLVVSPDNVAVVAPTTSPMLTLTTCNPRFSASTRLVIEAALITPPAPTPTPVVPAKTNAKAPTSTALAGEQGPWEPALWWGLAVLLAAVGGWFVSKRRERPRQRWAGYSVSAVAVLVLLFFFFGAVSPLLPASF